MAELRGIDSFLVLGLGSIGQRHVRNLLGIRPAARVFALRSGKGERQVPADLQLREISSLDELPAGGSTAALVCNPSSLHVPMASDLLDRGMHLFMEKPLSHDLTGVRELLAKADRLGRLIYLAYPFRQHPLLKQLKGMLSVGALGRPLWVRSSVGAHPPDWLPEGMDYRRNYTVRKDLGGGALLTLIHELDTVLFLLGAPLAVQARVLKLSDLETDTDDLAELWLEYQGALATVHMDFVQRGRGDNRFLELAGTGGRAWLDLTMHELRVRLGRAEQPEVFTLPDFDFNSLYVAEMQEFLACVEQGTRPAAAAGDGALAVRICEAARRSESSGARVSLEELE